jgi:3-oxoacyl-[acyl-carrier-protein] synthase-1
MDILSRLAFVAAEKLSEEFSLPLRECWGGSSLILFNHSSSIVSDRQYLSTISGAEFFPSPSVFVYTLPNIAAGEIAIRHHLQGETSFYILPDKDEAMMRQILEASLLGTNTKTVISGWVDAESEASFECELSMYTIT